jgi:hypothetical protein
MRWVGWAVEASGVEVEAASAWRRTGFAARRAEGLAERPRAGAAAFLGLGLGTAEKVLIRAMKASPLQCETPLVRWTVTGLTPTVVIFYLELRGCPVVKKM